MKNHHSAVSAFGIPLLALVGITRAAFAAEGDTGCKPRDERVVIDVAIEKHEGDRVSGPACIALENVNTLRYDVKIGDQRTFSAGPDLKLSFIPAPPAAAPPAKVQEIALGKAAETPEAMFTTFQKNLNRERVGWNATLGKIADAVEATNAASRAVQRLVASSDSVLQSAGGRATLATNSAAVATQIDATLQRVWPAGEVLAARLAATAVERDLRMLPAHVDVAQWKAFLASYQAAYDLELADALALMVAISGYDTASAPRQAFDQARDVIARWSLLLEGVTTDSFSRRHRAGCGGAFAMNSERSVRLFKVDRLSGAANALDEEIVTVVCESPFSVSSGIGLSLVDEAEWGIVSSTEQTTDAATGAVATAKVTRFAKTSDASQRVAPIVLINTRLRQFSEACALQFSAGAVVDVGTGEAGTDIEPIVAVSLSLWRTTFISVGWHFARTHDLGGGFVASDKVPEGVSAPPLIDGRASNFFAGVSVKLR